MKKISWLIGIVVVIIVVIIASHKNPNVNKTVKIGVILPLTGDLAFLGEPAKQAAQFAIEDMVSSSSLKYQLIFEDDQFNGQRAATAANKLVSIDKVNALITFGSSGGNVVNPIATKNKVIHFGIASDPKVSDGKYNFNHWTPPKEEVRVMVKQLDERGIKSVGIIVDNQAGMLAVAEELKKQLQDTKVAIVADETFNIGEKDFRALIAKVQPKNPQIYILICFSPELEILARQMKDGGIKTSMTSIESFDQTTEPKLFNGYWYVSASDPGVGFIESFKNRSGKTPGFGSANVYDILGIIITAFGKNQTDTVLSSDQISEELHKIQDYKGAMGNLSIEDNGSVFSEATVKTVSAK